MLLEVPVRCVDRDEWTDDAKGKKFHRATLIGEGFTHAVIEEEPEKIAKLPPKGWSGAMRVLFVSHKSGMFKMITDGFIQLQNPKDQK